MKIISLMKKKESKKLTFEHSSSTRQDDVVIKASSHVDGTLNDRVIDHHRKGNYELNQKKNASAQLQVK